MTEDRLLFWKTQDAANAHILTKACVVCVGKGRPCEKSFARRLCHPCEVSRATCSLKDDLIDFWLTKGIKFVTHRADHDVELGKYIGLSI